MGTNEEDPLPDWAPMALAHARGPLRGALAALLRFDGKLSRIVLGASEPALAQIRLAWWREELLREREADAMKPSNPMLAELLEAWCGRIKAIVAFIDGWEELLEPHPWPEQTRAGFENGHTQVFSALSELGDARAASGDARVHAAVWAQSKLAMISSDYARARPVELPSLPRNMRALAVIGGLSRRALLRGGKPLFGDRLSPLAGLRIGIFGT